MDNRRPVIVKWSPHVMRPCRTTFSYSASCGLHFGGGVWWMVVMARLPWVDFFFLGLTPEVQRVLKTVPGKVGALQRGAHGKDPELTCVYQRAL